MKAKFFRITVSVDGEHQVIPTIKWKDLLAQEKGRGHNERTLALNGPDFTFEPRGTGDFHLAVHRLKNETEFLSRMNKADGKFVEVMAVDEEGTYADTSCVVFKRDANVLGIVQANTAAPRANKVADWLTERNPLGITDAQYHAVPLRLDSMALQKMDGADGAKSVEVSVPVAELHELGINITADAVALANNIPGAQVTIKVSYGNSRPADASGSALLRFGKKIAQGITGDDRGKANIYRVVESQSNDRSRRQRSRLEAEVVDLVQFEIAHEFDLAIADGTVRIDSTLNAIEQGFARNARDLKKAYEAAIESG